MDKELKMLNEGHFSLPIITKLAKNFGIKYTINNTYTGKCLILEFPQSNVVVWDYPFNINSSASVKVCKNKDICNHFLKSFGFSVPSSINFTRRSSETNEANAKMILDFLLNDLDKSGMKYPLILKPAEMSQGVGVTKISNFEEAKVACSEIVKMKNKTFILQEFCEGNEYRVVVLGNEVIQVYQKLPFSIVGDGKRTIKELIMNRIQNFISQERDKKVDINDSRIWQSVEESGYTSFSVLKSGEKLSLQKIANLSLGGTSVDVLERVSTNFKSKFVNVSKSLGLDFCGIDVIAPDLTASSENNYKIIEVNSAPGLDNYLYDDKSKQEKYVESLYEQINDYQEHGNRWYDSDPVMQKSIELLRVAPSSVQRKAAKKLKIAK